MGYKLQFVIHDLRTVPTIVTIMLLLLLLFPIASAY